MDRQSVELPLRKPRVSVASQKILGDHQRVISNPPHVRVAALAHASIKLVKKYYQFVKYPLKSGFIYVVIAWQRIVGPWSARVRITKYPKLGGE
ncbi:hypothetical protein MUY21_10760 [Aliiroseovarius sp. S2029]|uniref:hypothetical protein n=1 Tax=Aliiroseovarius sp. S2029 TaxID=2936988 RepID=UPI0020BFB0B3|nr:hypothetical protein [Aliiroseovarius sp. S2029]MCK8484519.1 hypothetical protein [Aliiroseovarius sp. S2029]